MSEKNYLSKMMQVKLCGDDIETYLKKEGVNAYAYATVQDAKESKNVTKPCIIYSVNWTADENIASLIAAVHFAVENSKNPEKGFPDFWITGETSPFTPSYIEYCRVLVNKYYKSVNLDLDFINQVYMGKQVTDKKLEFPYKLKSVDERMQELSEIDLLGVDIVGVQAPISFILNEGKIDMFKSTIKRSKFITSLAGGNQNMIDEAIKLNILPPVKVQNPKNKKAEQAKFYLDKISGIIGGSMTMVTYMASHPKLRPIDSIKAPGSESVESGLFNLIPLELKSIMAAEGKYMHKKAETKTQKGIDDFKNEIKEGGDTKEVKFRQDVYERCKKRSAVVEENKKLADDISKIPFPARAQFLRLADLTYCYYVLPNAAFSPVAESMYHYLQISTGSLAVSDKGFLSSVKSGTTIIQQGVLPNGDDHSPVLDKMMELITKDLQKVQDLE